MGHIRRSLVLADELSRRGVACTFLVSGADGAAYVSSGGHEAMSLDDETTGDTRSIDEYLRRRGCDALVLDTYDVKNVAELRSTVPVVVLDDLADRYLPVAIVVNAAAEANTLDYDVAEDTRLLLGTEYALLRPQFAIPPSKTTTGRVLVTVGSMDNDGVTARVVTALATELHDADFDVAVGPFFSGDAVAAIEETGRSHERVVLHRGVTDMYPLYSSADIVVTAGGQTILEVAATGTACVGINLASNQTPNLDGLAASGAIAPAGELGAEGFLEQLGRLVCELWADPRERDRLGARARQLVDGRGAIRVADVVCGVLA